MKKIRKAVILLSGGLDSAVSCAIAKAQGFEIYALSFFYGQRHEVELISAKKLANFFGAKEHKIAEIDLRIFGNSALTAEISVPKDRAELGFQDKNEPQNNIPITYVPARNTIFLAYSLAFAEVIGAFDIFIGVNSIDYSGYPDCRPEFIRSFEKMANLATAASTSLNSDLISDFDSGLKSDANAENSTTKNKLKSSGGKFKIHTPLGKLSKKEIIGKGIELGVDFGLTHSCYDPVIAGDKVLACGHCDSCLLRLEGFKALGKVDAIGYVA